MSTTVSPDVQRRLDRKLDELMEVVFTHYPSLQGKLDRPALKFNHSIRVAGTANYKTNTITLSTAFLGGNPEHMEEMVNQTLPHEMAHILERAVYGSHERTRSGRRSIHGRRWQLIMSGVFGLSPDRCHTMKAEGHESRRLKKQYVYVCKCSEPHYFTSIRHGKVLKGAQYSCRSCKTKLKHVPEKRSV